MYEINQVLFDKRTVSNTFKATRHIIDEKVKVVDGDGKEFYLYHLTGYAVYFSEENLINDFCTVAKEQS